MTPDDHAQAAEHVLSGLSGHHSDALQQLISRSARGVIHALLATRPNVATEFDRARYEQEMQDRDVKLEQVTQFVERFKKVWIDAPPYPAVDFHQAVTLFVRRLEQALV